MSSWLKIIFHKEKDKSFLLETKADIVLYSYIYPQGEGNNCTSQLQSPNKLSVWMWVAPALIYCEKNRALGPAYRGKNVLFIKVLAY